MVPDTAMKTIYNAYEGLADLLERICILTNDKQKAIVAGEWGQLSEIVAAQNILKPQIEIAGKNLSTLTKQGTITDTTIETQKKKIKQWITQYKTTETINIRLLKDSLYTARIKASQIFHIPFNDDTYSSDRKITTSMGGGSPLFYDRLI